MRIKADLYSGRLFEYWEPKKRQEVSRRHRRASLEGLQFWLTSVWKTDSRYGGGSDEPRRGKSLRSENSGMGNGHFS